MNKAELISQVSERIEGGRSAASSGQIVPAAECAEQTRHRAPTSFVPTAIASSGWGSWRSASAGQASSTT